MSDDVCSSPEGLLQCLTALSEEAASLSLSRTFAALQEALAICRAEADTAPFSFGRGSQPALIH